MRKKPQKQNNPILGIVCIVVIVLITLARGICHFTGAEWSDTLTRVLGGVEIVAVAVLAYSYMKWRKK